MELGLLDTSTVILLGRIDDPAILPDQSVISAISLAELSVGPLLAVDPAEKAARQAHLQQAESDSEAIPFDAAAAIANGLPLYTCNPDDFDGIPVLDVRAVRHPDQ